VTLAIDLYRTDDYAPAGRVDLISLLQPVFEVELGQALDDTEFRLYFHPIVDRRALSGDPQVTNLRGSYGYVTVSIVRPGQGVIYRHGFPVREVIGRPLQRILAKRDPSERHWGFGVSGPGLEGIALERPAPRAVDSVTVAVGRRSSGILHLEEVTEPDPPLASWADLGVDGGEGPAGPSRIPVVVFAWQVHEDLTKRMDLSDEMEEGGFLIGRLLRDQASDRQVVQVTRAPRAERTGASLLDFTFTGESFMRVNQAVARVGDGSRLVGWYHTHLFRATDGVGLSDIDVQLHTSTFLQNWHVAALLNLDPAGGRVLRVYAWDGSAMRQVPYVAGAPWTP
jgi:proteasome lid subunit RPN8/RPN11